MLFHDQPHSLSVTHSLTHQPCFVQEAGADNHQSLLQINHPQILTHVAQKKKKNLFINPLLVSQTNSLPHDIATLRLNTNSAIQLFILTELHPESSPEGAECISLVSCSLNRHTTTRGSQLFPPKLIHPWTCPRVSQSHKPGSLS